MERKLSLCFQLAGCKVPTLKPKSHSKFHTVWPGLPYLPHCPQSLLPQDLHTRYLPAHPARCLRDTVLISRGCHALAHDPRDVNPVGGLCSLSQ